MIYFLSIHPIIFTLVIILVKRNVHSIVSCIPFFIVKLKIIALAIRHDKNSHPALHNVTSSKTVPFGISG